MFGRRVSNDYLQQQECLQRDNTRFSNGCGSGGHSGDCRLTEQRGGGDADGAAEADRLLLEELRSELFQTKLELEAALKAQHKHLKELDTLRSAAQEFDCQSVRVIRSLRPQ